MFILVKISISFWFWWYFSFFFIPTKIFSRIFLNSLPLQWRPTFERARWRSNKKSYFNFSWTYHVWARRKSTQSNTYFMKNLCRVEQIISQSRFLSPEVWAPWLTLKRTSYLSFKKVNTVENRSNETQGTSYFITLERNFFRSNLK